MFCSTLNWWQDFLGACPSRPRRAALLRIFIIFPLHTNHQHTTIDTPNLLNLALDTYNSQHLRIGSYHAGWRSPPTQAPARLTAELSASQIHHGRRFTYAGHRITVGRRAHAAFKGSKDAGRHRQCTYSVTADASDDHGHTTTPYQRLTLLPCSRQRQYASHVSTGQRALPGGVGQQFRGR